MNDSLFSVRMRASGGGRHLAGAERLVDGAAINAVVAAMMTRAMACANGAPDEIHCSVERVEPSTVRQARLPDLVTYQVRDWREGRRAAAFLLTRAGVRAEVAGQAVRLLAEGAGPGGAVMRGAVIMDATTGKRLESDPSRGVRVSRMDLAPECRAGLERALAAAELGHHRVLEALVLAGKVLSAPGVVAELCWSDDPDYVTGYVADRQGAYQRISWMKPVGDSCGGRIFLVDSAAAPLSELIDYLEHQAVLFNHHGTISPPVKWMENHE